MPEPFPKGNRARVKAFADELRGIAYNIATSPSYGGRDGSHDIAVLEKVAELFESLSCD